VAQHSWLNSAETIHVRSGVLVAAVRYFQVWAEVYNIQDCRQKANWKTTSFLEF
jgi:hypothetical protein